MNDSYDLVIRNGRVISGHINELMDVAVRGGKIAALCSTDAALRADAEIDATGLLVMPGGIDTHTHVAWPYDGTFTVDDFFSATRSAVLSGTTTIVDFVPPGPDHTLHRRCHERVEEASEQAVIDFGFHPILTSADDSVVAQLPAVIADGFSSFKMYTTYEDRRIDDGAAWTLMQAIAANGGLPGFHAESHEVLGSTLSAQVRSGHLSLQDYPASRPGLAEAETIQMVSFYARRIGTPVYIFHVSGSDALSAVREARSTGSRVFAETCTHYLALDEGVFAGPDAWRYVISPPIRSKSDRDDLWRAISEGVVTSVGSDHCAYETSRKCADIDDHRHIPAGAPGIEARTPMLWHQCVEERQLDPRLFVAVSAERAARVLGLYPRKGAINVGSDADIVIWDSARQWAAEDLPVTSQHTFSLYDGFRGRGLPRHVLAGGELVVNRGEFVGAKGRGRFLKRDRVGGPIDAAGLLV
jgi:dihydropyrimidinase